MNKFIKFLHFLFISLWVGGSIGMLLLYWFIKPDSNAEILIKYNSLNIIDYALIIPGAIGNIVTGVFFGLKTNWGFFKYRWISVKWVLSASQIIFGTLFLGRWLKNNSLIINDKSYIVLTDTDFSRNEIFAKYFSILQVILLIFLIYISVVKPKFEKLIK